MEKNTGAKGFTLVELAIVMTIIGLLIGGILKGQELMQNARVTATISQVRAYEAAVTTFRDKYDAVPGDMANASVRIPGCTAACNPTLATQAGNTIVGLPGWGAGGWAAQAGVAVALMAGQAQSETALFWPHLLLSDVISGVTNAALTGGGSAWGSTHPAAKIGGGFIVGFADSTAMPGATVGSAGPGGMILVLANAPAAALAATTGTQPLTSTRAAQIDRKMDDGRPRGGYVWAYGLNTACFSSATTGLAYLESQTGNHCGLAFRIQG